MDLKIDHLCEEIKSLSERVETLNNLVVQYMRKQNEAERPYVLPTFQDLLLKEQIHPISEPIFSYIKELTCLE